MPLAVEGRDVALGDGSGTAFAFQGEHGQVVLLAVGLAVLLLESILTELAAALSAEKVIRMPRLIQRRHAFLQWNQSVPLRSNDEEEEEKKQTSQTKFRHVKK